MKTVVVAEGQTILDLALKHYGCLEGVANIVADNNLGGATTALLAGQEIEVQETTPELTDKNRRVKALLDQVNVEVNALLTESPSGENCWVESGWIEDGWVGCADEAEDEDDLVDYFTKLLDELGILDDITLGRDVRIIAAINAGETIFSTYVDSETKGTYESIAGVNIDTYSIRVNEAEQTLPFELEVGDELEIEIVPVDGVLDAEITLDGIY